MERIVLSYLKELSTNPDTIIPPSVLTYHFEKSASSMTKPVKEERQQAPLIIPGTIPLTHTTPARTRRSDKFSQEYIPGTIALTHTTPTRTRMSDKFLQE